VGGVSFEVEVALAAHREGALHRYLSLGGGGGPPGGGGAADDDARVVRVFFDWVGRVAPYLLQAQTERNGDG